jgi:hypothetical protein
MAINNDNDLEELDFGENQPNPDQPGGKKPGNRTFLLALALLGGILVVAVAALLAVVFLVMPGRTAAQNQQRALQLAANTATAQFATVSAEKALILLTPSATVNPPTAVVLATATNTPVIAPAATKILTATNTGVPDAQKATLAAQQTQLAAGKLTTTVMGTNASTALPTTGFAEEVGLPGLLGVGAALIVIIFLARRIRTQ